MHQCRFHFNCNFLLLSILKLLSICMDQYLHNVLNICYLLYNLGNWKDQLEHIYTHLLNQCNVDSAFRSKIGQPKLGKVSKYWQFFAVVVC